MTEAQSPLSPAADIRAEPPSSRRLARSLRDNAIGIFPPAGVRRRSRFSPHLWSAADHHEPARRYPAHPGRQFGELPPHRRRHPHFAPAIGQGAFAQSGRGLAPAAPHLGTRFCAAHTADLGAPCRASAASAAVADLEAASAHPVDLLAAMQFLALEIAGASMFSLEIVDYGAELRGLIKRYAAPLAGRASWISCCRCGSRARAMCCAGTFAGIGWCDPPDHRRAPRAMLGRSG